ncbi:MAG TPA: RnfABCDGE type electron transport complex subunit D [Clostridia bacterium]|mgnify:CR=1 FL=1|nr:RnfABCDGE type electron transport complex subunit D [Clostridia bacterium]
MSLRLSTAPHIRSIETTKRLMADVVIALMPAALVGIYYFGPNAALLVGLSAFTAVLTEYLWQKSAKKPVCIGDLSALVTGLLLGLNLPPTAPWWLAVFGSFLAIALVKQLFGGLGHNFMNPALTSRAILLASWPVRMTSFVMPTYFVPVEAVASATPLGGLPASTLELFLGTIPGTIGEVCKAAILLGLLYLLIRGTVYPHVPTIFLFVTALLGWALGTNGGFTFDGDPLAAILSGGVMFGAVFMATDYATSPMTKKGQAIFAAGCGLILSVIRAYSKLPEGATYAILLMNIATPLIDKYIKPTVYGSQKAVKGVKANA